MSGDIYDLLPGITCRENHRAQLPPRLLLALRRRPRLRGSALWRLLDQSRLRQHPAREHDQRAERQQDGEGAGVDGESIPWMG